MPGCRQMLIYKERNPIWGSKGNTVSPVLVRCLAADRCWFTKERNPIWGSKQIQTPLSPVLVQLKQTACCFWASTAILWWVKVKIDLAVKTRCIQEGYECRTLAVGEQKVRKFCVYFSNITPQRVATLVSHSETNPKNKWMRGEQACLELGCIFSTKVSRSVQMKMSPKMGSKSQKVPIGIENRSREA